MGTRLLVQQSWFCDDGNYTLSPLPSHSLQLHYYLLGKYTKNFKYIHCKFVNKGGSRVLGRGGGTKKIEVTVHVVVPSTGRRPVDATLWASPGGVPPPELEKNEIMKCVVFPGGGGILTYMFSIGMYRGKDPPFLT